MTVKQLASAVAGALASTALLLPGAVHAASVEVKMLDRDSNGNPKVFRPAVTEIEPGDTVEFVATDFGHDLESLQALRPKGAAPFQAPKNAGATVTFEKEGIHVYHCAAHKTMGMVGVIVVGDATVNLAEVRQKASKVDALSAQGKERLARMLNKVKTQIATKQ